MEIRLEERIISVPKKGQQKGDENPKNQKNGAVAKDKARPQSFIATHTTHITRLNTGGPALLQRLTHLLLNQPPNQSLHLRIKIPHTNTNPQTPTHSGSFG